MVRQVAEATVLDPAERAAVAHEVAQMQREGVDVNSVIPTEVREAAQEEFAKVQGQMQEQLETLRTTDPGAAHELELKMQESERAIQAFESGESYQPSPEMVAQAQEMFHDWEAEMTAQGASPEFLERAKMEFATWSEGGQTDQSGQPTPEQMQAMGMSQEQIQMAEAYAQGEMPAGVAPGEVPTFEHSNFEAYAPSEIETYTPGGDYEHQIEQFGPEHEYTLPENQTYDNTQEQLQTQSQTPSPAPSPEPPPSTESLLRSEDHFADHNGDTVPEHHLHEIFQHSDGTCHDHTDNVPASC